MRVLLKGQGDPIPVIALPNPGQGFDLPSQSFMLTDDVPFLKAEYAALGYTHYEVWCIGAAGGSGGNIFLGGTQDEPPAGAIMSYGGRGGGGGLHRVSGLLSELPASCPVTVGVVGQAGTDGNGEARKFPVEDGSGNIVHNQYYDNPLWVPPTPGQDGGASSFNEETCQASGGKGGAASPCEVNWRYIWDDTPIADAQADRLERLIFHGGPGGDGGQGGSGGRILAGGGADGGKSVVVYGPEGSPPALWAQGFTETDVEDGGWDGTIGEGGGGGRGGNLVSPGRNATAGGLGSYSFSDTSVYGPRQNRSGSAQIQQIPGFAGGAKLNKLAVYGSLVQGGNPNGAVFIRVMKIT